MKPFNFGTNTKMYKTIRETVAYLADLDAKTQDLDRTQTKLFVIPSYTSLDAASHTVSPERILLGAQNMCWESEGQFTGEISPRMLAEVGVRIVELGHSERRHVFGETDAMVRNKVRCAMENGFITLLCIGETGEQKALGLAAETLRIQLKTDLFDVTEAQVNWLWVAYEPVWAIGTNGVPASEAYVANMHAIIRNTLCERFPTAGVDVPILYGGSVNPQNAVALSRQAQVNGLFIGRSAWDADRFNHIIRAVLSDLAAQ